MSLPSFDRGEFRRALHAITEISKSRCERWHGEKGLEDWSGLEWAGAMAGEAGEAANVAKKILRRERGIAGQLNTPEAMEADIKQLGDELADVFHYLVLLAARYNIPLDAHIIDKFNVVSTRSGFPETL